MSRPITALNPGFTCHFQVLAARVGWGGGVGILDEILILPLPENEEKNVIGMEETLFKADHSQHGNYQKPTGRLRIYAPKIILFVLGCRKMKKEVLIKVSFSVRWGFGCLKRALNFYTPFSIHFAATYR